MALLRLAGAERLCALDSRIPTTAGPLRHSSTSRNRVRRKAFRVVAATLVSRLMDERARRNCTRAAEIGPAFPLTFRPVVLPFPENFGKPPKSRQRLVHHCIGVGGGIGAGFSEHDVHPAGTDKKTRVDCLVEHPLKGYLGEAALRFRIAAPHIAVHTRKPDLLEVAGAALRQAILRHPEICPEEGASFVDGDGLAADLDVRIIACVRQTQRVFVPANRAHRVPYADKPGLADLRRESAFEIGSQIEITLLFLAAMAVLAVDCVVSYQHAACVGIKRSSASWDQTKHAEQGGNGSHRIGTAAEPEKEDTIALLEIVHQKNVSVADIRFEPITKCPRSKTRKRARGARERAGRLHCAKPRMVISNLTGRVAFKRKEQFDDVRAIFGKLVRSAVAAKDHVFCHGVPDLGSMVGVAERIGSVK